MSVPFYFCSGLTIFICSISILILGIYYNQYLNTSEFQCHITHVRYPTEIPNNDNHQGFVECDCGRRCTSDLGTCISVYGSIIGSDNEKLFNQNIIGNYYDDTCTFRETNCPSGEKISDRREAVRAAIQKASYYVNIKKNNNNISCYQDENRLYLSKEYDPTLLLVSVGICSVVLTLNIYYYVKNKYLERLEIKKLQENSNFQL